MDSNHARLLWRCRRGIREMDILLENFMNTTYPKLKQADKEAFEHLLDESDMDIYNWIKGSSIPDQKELQSIVQHLIVAAKTLH